MDDPTLHSDMHSDILGRYRDYLRSFAEIAEDHPATVLAALAFGPVCSSPPTLLTTGSSVKRNSREPIHQEDSFQYSCPQYLLS